MPEDQITEQGCEMEPASASKTETDEANNKAEKFSRVATQRVNKAIDAIEKIGALSPRASYEYTQEQVDAMFGAIEEALANEKVKFAEKKSFSF